MKKIGVLGLGLLFATMAFCQVANFQSGISLSKLEWKIGSLDMEQYKDLLIGYSFFAGMDYAENKYYNLSSNLGVVRKGGTGETIFTDENGNPIGTHASKATLDYLSLNTLLELKYPITEQLLPFLSFGPRFDYLVNNNKDIDIVKEADKLNSISFGLILGGGLKYDFSKIQIGLRADYYMNFSKIADWPMETDNLGGEISDNTYTVNFTIGYKLLGINNSK